MQPDDLFPTLIQTIDRLETNAIALSRQQFLLPFVDYLKDKVGKGETIRLNFICTHNSRRSHLAQAWAQAMAAHFGIKDVFCYSGGTESTALFPATADALRQAGFEITMLSDGFNPVHAIKFAENAHPIIGFSKRYDHPFNPKAGFGAIMTCSEADKGCPYVVGAEQYLPITFEDPKVSDGTPQQAETYHFRSLQIAQEMKFVFEKASGK